MTSTAEHSADEAGGEAVFFSDGLPSLTLPLPPPVPPIPTSSGEVDDDNNDAVIEGESGIDPRAAFEPFFANRRNDAGWSALSSSYAGAVSDDEALSGNLVMEDPRRRLFRLKAEIDQLEGVLAKEAREGESGNDEDLHSMALELKLRLGAMGLGEGDGSLATMLRGRQKDLSGVILRDVEKFSKKSLEDDSVLNKGAGESGKIVYELYKSSGILSQAASGTSPREAQLEERLRRLEIVMGMNREGKGADGGKTLLERLDEAEHLAKEVDVKEVEKIAAKAKVIRSDLEAAARAKAKLSSNSSNPSSLSAQDSQIITALHSQLVELEGISADIPALTLRLTELSNLHSNAAEFGARLDAAEGAASRSEVLLRFVEETLEKMEAVWAENMKAVEENMKRLDKISGM